MRLCIALDMQSRALNLDLAIEVANNFSAPDIYLKVGLRTFIRDGKEFIADLKRLGFKIFLDLKLYDIPNTMLNSLFECEKIGIDLLSIHASSGTRAIRELRRAIDNNNFATKIIIVSALTSFSNDEFLDIYNCNIQSGVRKFANSGDYAHGIVCSFQELELIKNINKNLITVVPGIRFKSANDDQRRISTPMDVKNKGGDIIVVGRPIYQSNDRVQIIKQFIDICT